MKEVVSFNNNPLDQKQSQHEPLEHLDEDRPISCTMESSEVTVRYSENVEASIAAYFLFLCHEQL